MDSPQSAQDFQALTRETQAIWDANADFWATYIGEGNRFQLDIVNPATDRLLGLRPGERVLDIACGNGNCARRMASMGAEVVAFDFSEHFIAWARQRSAEMDLHVDYRVLDATDEAQLLELGERGFDAAVCNMALMDMTTITPLMAGLARLLKPGGRFVFSVMHPCFNSTAVRNVVEREDRDGHLVTTYGLKVTDYLGMAPTKGLGIIGQPQPHYYFHRPISLLFGECFGAGFVLDGLEEPPDPSGPSPERPLSWGNIPGIPPALVARMVLLG